MECQMLTLTFDFVWFPESIVKNVLSCI